MVTSRVTDRCFDKLVHVVANLTFHLSIASPMLSLLRLTVDF